MKKFWLLFLLLSIILPLVAGFLLSSTPVYAQAPGFINCTQDVVDIREYVAPQCGGANTCQINASSISTTDRYIGNVNNSIEWVDGSRYKQNSNDVHFLYEVTGSYINFLQDTIWDPYTCTNGKDAMYRVYDGASSNWGAHLLPVQMSCGVPHTYQSYIQALEYDPQVETQVDIALNQCTVNGQGTDVVTNSNELFFQGVATCNGNRNLDIIGIRNLSGAGAGEVYFYCKGRGLCAWYQELNFSAPGNNPKKWTSKTDVCNLDTAVGDYYLYPINGLNQTQYPNPSEQVGVIFNDLVDQGYQAYCTTPTFTLQGSKSGAIDRFKQLFAPGSNVFDIKSNLNINSEKGLYPLWRSSSDSPSLMSSLEHYWGYQDTKSEDLATKELNSSPLYKLLTVKEQCEQKLALLRSTKALCVKLEQPNSCALYKPIPGFPQYTTRTILERFEQEQLNCDAVANNTVPESKKTIADALMNTPLYLDKSYRLAFLIIVTQLQAYNESVYFNFLRIPDKLASFTQGRSQPDQDVRVVAFRIPDVGTNKNPNDPGFYEDPLAVTNNILSTSKEIEQRYQAQAEEKVALKNAFSQERVKCSVFPGANSEDEIACQDPLSKALIDLVNKQPEIGGVCNATPTELKAEEARKIMDNIDLNANTTTNEDGTPTLPEDPQAEAQFEEGVTFKPNYNVLKNLFSQITGQQDTPQQAEFNFISRLDSHKDGGEASKVQMYLVYPVGYELKDVELRLAGIVFDSANLEQYLADPEIENYFSLSGIETQLESEEQKREFFDPAKCMEELRSAAARGVAPDLKKCNQEVTASVEDDQQFDRQPRVLGGLLGNLMRTMLLTNPAIEFGSPIYNYLASCENTEQFLTGNCSGSTIGETAQGNDTSSLRPLAECKLAVTGRITSGETATHIPDPTNPQCYLYDEATHLIPDWTNPNDGAKDCTTLYSYAGCTYPTSLIANFVDSNGKFVTQGTETACEYIVRRAREANISPRFALAMWGEESGFSGTDAWDLGVTSQPKKDLKAQFDAFENLVDIYRDETNGFERFMLRYSGEGAYGAWNPGTPFCANKYFPGRLKTYYDYLAP